ncbi:MAG: AsmA family protein [Verrucomicrobiales bacterium]|nr:AsmA family protein [Verrucomicrobiales bacterium]
MRRSGRWVRRVLIGLGLCAVVLVAAYLVATSAPFIKAIVLPRLGRQLGVELTVADASVQPFKLVLLRGVKAQPPDHAPVFSASEVRARYSLWSILRGKLTVHELAVESPVFTLIQNADGTSNLDPIRTALAKRAAPAAAQPPAKPLQLDIGRIAINKAAVEVVERRNGAVVNLRRVTNISIAISDLRDGHTARLTIEGDVHVAQGTGIAALAGKLSGEFAFGLLTNARLHSISGKAQWQVTSASGNLSELALLRAELKCDVRPTEIAEVSLRFFRSTNPLGQLRLSGTFDVEKAAGDLTAEILNLDKHVLNLAGAAGGLDFGPTKINSTNRIRIAPAAAQVSVAGQLDVRQLSVRMHDQSTPALDLQANYSLNIDRIAKRLELLELTISGVQGRRQLIDARLARPMAVSWGTGIANVPDSAFELQITGIDLADWKPFTRGITPAGSVDLQAKLATEQGGKILRFAFGASATAAELVLGTNRVGGLSAKAQIRGYTEALERVVLSEFRADAAARGHEVFALAGAGNFDIAGQLGEAQLRLKCALPAITALLANNDLNLQSGTIVLETRFGQTQQTQRVAGTLQLDSASGRIGPSEFTDWAASAEFDLSRETGQIEFKRIKCGFFQGGKPCGDVVLNGKFSITGRSGEANLQLTGLTERALAPLLGPMLKEFKLASVTMNGTVATKLEQVRTGSAKLELQITNLVMADLQGRKLSPPLGAKLVVDSLIQTQAVELRQCELTLDPTPRAANKVSVAGSVAAAGAGAVSGTLRLTSDALDLTPFYDAFAGFGAQKAPSRGTPPPAQEQTEPEPVQLPFANLSLDLAIKKLYLRDVEAANLLVRAQIRGARVSVDPARLELGSGRVNAKSDLDLGVPGWSYEVAFSAADVPIAPLANSFSTDYRGLASGRLFAEATIKGRGITGSSLQRALTGAASITLTNANVQMVGRKTRLLVTPIALVLGLEELTRAAVTGVDARLVAGNGAIRLTHAEVVSDLFVARTGGEILIAPRLPDSRINDWPVNIALRRSLAEKARLIAPGTDADAAFIHLPIFAKLGGTVSQPEAKIDKLVIAGMIAKAAGAIPGVAGDKAGAILQGVGGLLTGQFPGQPGTATNQVPTNGAPAKPVLPLNPLDLFKRR